MSVRTKIITKFNILNLIEFNLFALYKLISQIDFAINSMSLQRLIMIIIICFSSVIDERGGVSEATYSQLFTINIREEEIKRRERKIFEHR